jgi:hypothetical protein
MSTQNNMNEDWKSLENQGWADMKSQLDAKMPEKKRRIRPLIAVAATFVCCLSAALFLALGGNHVNNGFVAANQNVTNPSSANQELVAGSTSTVDAAAETKVQSKADLTTPTNPKNANLTVSGLTSPNNNTDLIADNNSSLANHSNQALATRKVKNGKHLENQSFISSGSQNTDNQQLAINYYNDNISVTSVESKQASTFITNAALTEKATVTAPQTSASFEGKPATNNTAGGLADLYAIDRTYSGNSAPINKPATSANTDGTAIIESTEVNAETVQKDIKEEGNIQVIKPYHPNLPFVSPTEMIVQSPKHAVYFNAMTTNWNAKGGYQLGLSRSFFLPKRFSIKTGLEVTRIYTYINTGKTIPIQFNATNASEENKLQDYSYYNGGTFSNQTITESELLPTPTFDQLSIYNDEQGYAIFRSDNIIYGTYRHYIGVPVLIAYKWKRLDIETGGAYWFQLDKHGPIPIGDNSLSFNERSNFVLQGGLGYHFYRRFSVTAGYRQGVKQLSTSGFRLLAPDRSISLGLRFDIN